MADIRESGRPFFRPDEHYDMHGVHADIRSLLLNRLTVQTLHEYHKVPLPPIPFGGAKGKDELVEFFDLADRGYHYTLRMDRIPPRGRNNPHTNDMRLVIDKNAIVDRKVEAAENALLLDDVATFLQQTNHGVFTSPKGVIEEAEAIVRESELELPQAAYDKRQHFLETHSDDVANSTPITNVTNTIKDQRRAVWAFLSIRNAWSDFISRRKVSFAKLDQDNPRKYGELFLVESYWYINPTIRSPLDIVQKTKNVVVKAIWQEDVVNYRDLLRAAHLMTAAHLQFQKNFKTRKTLKGDENRS